MKTNSDNNEPFIDLYTDYVGEGVVNSSNYSFVNNSPSSNNNSDKNKSKKITKRNKENIKKKRKNKIKLKDKYFICRSCKKGLYFEFDQFNRVKYDCDCMTIQDCTVDNFIKKNSINNKDELESFCKCKKHNKKFIEYCKTSSADICEDCLEQKKMYKNYKKVLKYHEDHIRINLIQVDDILDKIKKLLKKIKLEALSEGDIDIRRILNIIVNLVRKYKEYPCYNLYKSLLNSHNYLLNFHFPKMKTMLKITSREELEKNIKNSDQIKIIKINKEKFSNISILKEMNLKCLEELELMGNDIEDITPLKYCNFENLKKLYLSDNQLNNGCLKVLKNIQIPKLEELNLFKNKITTTEVFDIIKEQYFPNLNTFYVGENKLDEKEMAEKKIYYFPPKIKVFGFTGTVTSENIDFIYKLKIEKLTKFYISRSLLPSISFIKEIKFEKLEEFIANFNQLTNLNEITYFNAEAKKSLKKIYLKGNKISNFDNIENIIKDFKKLEEINLEDNPINFNDYQEIIKKLENERKIKIIYKTKKKL